MSGKLLTVENIRCSYGEKEVLKGVTFDAEENSVVLGSAEDLMVTRVKVDDVNMMSVAEITEPISCTGKLRYSQKDMPCTIIPGPEGSVVAEFDEPVRAATPGQSAVFYKDDVILCGGVLSGRNDNQV